MKPVLVVLLGAAALFGQSTPRLRITTGSLPDGTVGVLYMAAIAIQGGQPPLRWDVSAGNLPPGLGLGDTGAISGTPERAGQYGFQIRVRDSDESDRQNYSVAIAAAAAADPPTITTQALPGGTVAVAYSASLAASGGTPPYAWTAGGLPSGLALSGATIQGIPVEAGSFTVQVQVTDQAGGTAQKSLALMIATPIAPPTITTAALPDGLVGTPYSAGLSASGGVPPLTWAATGLPPGLSLNGPTVSGTPTSAGTFTIGAQVRDALGRMALANVVITIASPVPPPTIQTSSLPDGIRGVAYSSTLAATGGDPPYTWSATGLPPGLTVTGNTVTGTPTQAGTFNVSLGVVDNGGRTANRSVVAIIDYRVNIGTESLPRGAAGVAYSASLTATEGVGPYTWSATGLPAGLSVSGGAISGTPTAPGTFQVQVNVRDANNHSASRTLPLEIVAPPSITTNSLPAGTTGTAYSATVQATSGVPPYRWSAQGLPGGLTIGESNGQISGTPTAAGTANVDVRVTDTLGGSASNTLPLLVVEPLSISEGGLPGGVTGAQYSATLRAAGGVPPYTWTVAAGSLPPGLSLASGGAIAGAPNSAGDFQFRARVADSRGTAAEAVFRIAVIEALALSETSLPSGAVGTDYSFRLQASGGRAPYNWSISAGALPAGLTLDATTGTISGKPTAPGDRSFSVTVTDATGQSAVSGFSLSVASTLSVSSPSPLPPAAVGTDYSYSFAALAGTPPYTWTAPGQLPPGLSLNRTTGVLSGRPTQSGSFNFPIRVTDAANASVSKDFALTIAGALSITNDEALPGGSIGAPYTATLTAVAGTSPYTWSTADGSLPPGLSLVPAGGISGTPAQEGTFRFTARVQDATGATATKPLTIVISSALRITTAAALPAGAVGQGYSQRLQVAGGASPYRWQVATGSLPPGLNLNANTGDLGGTPTTAGAYEFTIGVIDARNATTAQAMQLQVTLEGLPVLQMTGLPETAGSLEQRPITLRLDRNTTVALAGRLTLSFQPDSVVAGDDPSIQFSTGGRTVDFTVPANSSVPNLPPQLALQTGSVAGLITVEATLGTGSSPAPAGAWTVRVARAAPVVRSVRLVRTGAGLEVWVTGYSNTRDLGTATFDFQQGSSALQTTQVRQEYGGPARQWFQDAGSRVFGAQFTIIQPFTLSGDQGAVAGVTVTLTNSVGASRPVPGQF